MINWNAIAELFIYDSERPLLFNSLSFFILFTAFYVFYISLRYRKSWRIIYTLLFSLLFYYKSSGIYFLILIFSTVADFALGHLIYHASNKRWKLFYLIFSMFINLGMLAYFKYTNFFISSLNASFGTSYPLSDIFLPVGISFFTFQTMSYSIDIYRGQLIPITENIKDQKTFWSSLADFGFFVSFFPQLVAGPIVRAAQFLPQINRPLALNQQQLGQGFALIISGLFKKAVISDYISINYVDRVFESPELYSGVENLLAIYGYGIQIYCDFSGYSDMAIGLALLLGFHLPENFRLPYQSSTLQEFWRRWHISLSTWLRDYLYISLGGNRKGKIRTYINLMITMLLGGLWHGASWVFIIWGGLHGLGLAIDRLLSRTLGIVNESARSFIILLLIHLGGLVWVLFYFPSSGPERFLHLKGIILSGLIWIIIYASANALDQLLKLQEKAGYFSLRKVVSVLFTFHFVLFCWVLFRSGALNNPNPPMETAGGFFTQLLTQFNWTETFNIITAYPTVFSLMLLAMILHWIPLDWHRKVHTLFSKAPLPVKAFSLALVIWFVIQTASSDVVPFIYFQF